MTDDKPNFTRKQLDEWQRKDQRKRQEAAEKALTRTEDGKAPDGLPLWLDPSESNR